MKIREIMATSLYTVSSDKSVGYASERMNDWKVGSLIVMDHGQVTGIITSRDVRSAHPNRIVADAMTPDPIRTTPDRFIWDALKIMDEHRIERILIQDGEELVGLATREAIKLKVSEFVDPLSGLYRAPYIQYAGEALLDEGRPFHVLFIDLNDFGQINKLYGHPFGDDVIREFSNKASAAIVEGRDYLCRYAGDEFVMLTLADDKEIEGIKSLLTEPIVLDGIPITAAVGHLNGNREPGFFTLTLREMLSRASLLSTSLKEKNPGSRQGV